MKDKLTKRTVDAYQPKAQSFDVFDTDVPGFHLRVERSGRKVYRLKYVAFGRQRVIKIGEHGLPWTPDQARREAERLRGQVVGQIDPQAERERIAKEAKAEALRNVKLVELIERWLVEGRDAAPSKREISWATDATALRRHIVPTLGAIPTAQITKSDVERAQRQITNGETAVDVRTRRRGRAIVRGGAGIARRSIAALSACMSWAIDQGIRPDNPCARVKKPPQRKLERYLSREEAGRLLNAIEELESTLTIQRAYGDMIRLLLLTGARKSEIQKLRWAEIDLDRGAIALPRERSKTGEKSIALSQAACTIIARQVRSGPVVFPARGNAMKSADGLSKVWRAVRAHAGLEDVRLHDLRHSFASFAAASGASLLLIGKALGHTQASTTARYAHLDDNPVRALSEQVALMIVGDDKAAT